MEDPKGHLFAHDVGLTTASAIPNANSDVSRASSLFQLYHLQRHSSILVTSSNVRTGFAPSSFS